MIINCDNWHEFLENINDYHGGETDLRIGSDQLHIVRKPKTNMSVNVLLGTWDKKTGKGKVFTHVKSPL
jgi:hypothetical protein